MSSFLYVTVKLYKHKSKDLYTKTQTLHQNLLDRGPLVDDLPLNVESLHYETEAKSSFGKKSNCERVN